MRMEAYKTIHMTLLNDSGILLLATHACSQHGLRFAPLVCGYVYHEADARTEQCSSTYTKQ
jgi:hypothetical protein